MTRVGITTDRYGHAARSYAGVGLIPVPLPCIRFEPAPVDAIAAARSDAVDADLIFFTSPRTVRLLWPEGGMPDVAAAVVGPSTALAVLEAGGQADLVGDSGLDRLIDLAAHSMSGSRVTIARAAGSDPASIGRLRGMALQLRDHVIYRMTPMAPDMVPVDAVSFASPSAVDGWCLGRTLDDVVVGAIGETTARAVARHRPPDVVAKRPSHPDLARAIATYMEVKI